MESPFADSEWRGWSRAGQSCFAISPLGIYYYAINVQGETESNTVYMHEETAMRDPRHFELDAHVG